MREIKFRAWDEGNKVMHTDVEFIKSGDDTNDWICISSNEQQYKVEGHRLVFDNPYCRQQIHLMQYTGLKDKNGKEIYEGDIVTRYHLTGQVSYHAQRAMFIIQDGFNEPLYQEIYGVEVIGNIFEHPQLLNSVRNDETSVATDDAQ